MDMCSSPQLFAAYHVLLRLPVPRHPPDALVNLTINTCIRVICRIFSSLLLVRFSLSSRRCRNVENLDLRRLCSFDFSEFLVSLNKLTSWNRRYTHFCAYLDSLSICLTFGVIQFSRYMTITQYWLLWWAWVDSNYRPHAYQACALTCWATGP